MATGKYISPEEARKANQLDRFAKEHQAEDNKNALMGIIAAMVRKPESADQTSGREPRGED